MQIFTVKKIIINIPVDNRILFLLCAFLLLISVGNIAQTDTIQTNVPHLKYVYSNDFYIGCILSYRNIGFPTDPYVPGQSPVVTPEGGYLVKYHMNSMTPGNNMKPDYTVDISSSAAAYAAATTQAQKDSIDVHPIIRFNGDMIAQLNWAQRQGFTFRGHTLVWHNQTPAAFFLSGYTSTGTRLSKEKMLQRMDFYIEEIFRLIHESWPGLLSAFDIVNEAIDDNTGSVRTTGNNWYTTFGDSTYIMDAFQLARKYTIQYGETQIKLYYNDYNTDSPKKADGIVRLLTPIFQAGYLDGIGMQEHDNLFNPTAQQFIDSYNKFYSVCNEMAVTELDVATGSANPSPLVLARQADQYGMLFKCFVERSYRSGRGKIINVTKDGLNDQYTFQANQSSSLWDANNQCKPAFFAVVGVGNNYNYLDSLIKYSDTLQEKEYTTTSWLHFTSELTLAKNVIGQEYSVSVSADTILGDAKDSLKAAIDSLVSATVQVADNKENLPKNFSLSQNFPNPFNPSTKIKYSIPKTGYISLKVYNMLGQEVATLFSGLQKAGNYSINFDGSELSSGIYLYTLQSAGGVAITKKFILMK